MVIVVSALCAAGVGVFFLLSQHGPTSDGMLESMAVAALAGVLTGAIAVSRTRAKRNALMLASMVLLVNLAIAGAVLWWTVQIVQNLE